MIETVNIQDVHARVNGLKPGYSMMECPHCKAEENGYNKLFQTWKFDRAVSPIRYRYICGLNAKHSVQYEI